MSTNGSGGSLVAGLGDTAGTRALIGVLLAHRRLPVDAIGSALAACVDAGIVDSDIVIPRSPPGRR